MTLDESQLKELGLSAQEAAQRAAEIIQQSRTEELQLMQKQGRLSKAASVVTQVDLACQNVILEKLAESIRKYDLGLLTEELQDDQSRLLKDYFWCIDPLDGTLPFTENRPGYAVSIALVAKTGIPVIGVIYDPVSNTSCTAIQDQGVHWSPKAPIKVEQTNNELVCYFDRSFTESTQFATVRKRLEQIATDMNLTQLTINTGAGAVMNALSLLQHAHAAYFKFPKKEPGGGSLWDYAATTCIFNECMLAVTDSLGTALNLNNEHTTFLNESGVLYATHRQLTKKIIKVYKDLSR